MTGRGHIDYRMQRRALLRDVTGGLRSPREVCDAHPDLVRAGRSIGEETDADCPICDDGKVRRVTYAFYGKGKTRYSGRAIVRDALTNLVVKYGASDVYIVEVCPDCGWHHLIEAYALERKPA